MSALTPFNKVRGIQMENEVKQPNASVEAVKTFTQDEVNGIVAKEVAKASRSKVDAEELAKVKAEVETYKKQYEELHMSKKNDVLKETYIKNGGSLDKYDAFIKLNDGILSKDIKDFDSEVKKSVGKVPYLFDELRSETKKPNGETVKENIPRHFPF
jgi:hypothetical protein